MTRTNTSRARRSGGRAPVGLIWFVAGAIVAVVVIFVFPNIRETIKKTEKSTVQHARSLRNRLAKTPTANPGSASSHFDFYRLLSHPTQILTAGESGEVSQTPANQPVAQPGRYMLQVASFRDNADAQALKAQLALWGIAANVEAVNVQGETWHRVQVGPVNNLSTLNALREKLARHKLQPLLIRLGG